MAEAEQVQPQEKPGAGVDRTLIRELLALTPRERAKLAVQAARQLAAIHAHMKKRS